MATQRERSNRSKMVASTNNCFMRVHHARRAGSFEECVELGDASEIVPLVLAWVDEHRLGQFGLLGRRVGRFLLAA